MESGRYPSSEDPLSGGSQILGTILAIVTVGIPLIAVLSFSTPPRSPNLRTTSPPMINVVTPDDDPALRRMPSPEPADR